MSPAAKLLSARPQRASDQMPKLCLLEDTKPQQKQRPTYLLRLKSSQAIQHKYTALKPGDWGSVWAVFRAANIIGNLCEPHEYLLASKYEIAFRKAVKAP